MEETSEKVKPAIPFPDLFPEVVSAVAVGVFGVARAVAIALVERQEPRLRAFQAGGHIAFIGIDGEMNQRAFLECEEEFAVVAVAVLLNGDANGLAGEGVLEFGCGDGEAVQAEQEISFCRLKWTWRVTVRRLDRYSFAVSDRKSVV